MNAMDDDEDETDLFDDDEFDNLSETALQELENNAIVSTQAQLQKAIIQPQHVQNQTITVPPARIVAAQAKAQPLPRSLIPNPAFQRFLAEDDDSFELVGDEGIPTPVEEYDSFPLHRAQPSEAAQRELFRQQRHGQAYPEPGHLQSRQTARPQGDGAFPGITAREDEVMLDVALVNHRLPAYQSGDTAQNRLEQLIQERDDLTKELRTTKDTISMHKGEISIIRANFEKENRVHDRQIGALKKSMQEETAKYSAQINALHEKNNNLTTRYNFLQQDHNQELQESKTLRQRLRERPQGNNGDSPSTPRRGVASSLRDGFNDDDIMLVSPSKSVRHSKPPTPTAAQRRKRKAGEPSPIKPLVLLPSGQSHVDMPPPPPQPVQTTEQVVSIVRKDKQAERHLKFLQCILDYRTKENKEPLLEALIKFAFPSTPSKTFSTALLEGAAQLQGSRLPADLLQLFIDLWSKCMAEQYHKPIALLAEITTHIIELEASVLDLRTITAIMPLLQFAITINAERRFKHSPVNQATYGRVRQTPQSVLNHEVNGTSCLELMLLIAYTVSDEVELLDLFWRLTGAEFVLMMLSAWQPMSDITLILHLLATSTFPTTFASIFDDDQKQDQFEHWIVGRVTILLWDTPRVDEGVPPYTGSQLCQLRLEVMELLIHIAISSSPYPHDDPTHHGSLLLAADVYAIARLVRSLYDEVSAMYTLDPATHKLHAELINKGVSLLYHLLQVHGNTIDLQEKLSVINGGVYRHRVVLTRLAFSEGFVIDRCVNDETVTMATQMLEDSVTPDEADELVECFPGFKGRVPRDE